MLYKGKYRIETARRPEWDYAAAGFYFVTICTHELHPHFGGVIENESGDGAEMILSEVGQIAQQIWHKTPTQFPNAHLDQFIVMPNHVHGILQILNDDIPNAMPRNSQGGVTSANNPMTRRSSLPHIIRWYKGRTTFEARNRENEIPFAWQTRFYDRVIRSEEELIRIRPYIQSNPARWLAKQL